MRYALLGVIGAFMLAYGLPASAPASYPQLEPATQTDLSYNWAGYVATGQEYSGVSGKWIVPDVAGTAGTSADAAWVGIGGVDSADLLQAGTQAIVEDGKVAYQAWLEMMPAPSVPLPLTIAPGDEVAVSIQKIAADRWQVTVANHTTGDTYSTAVAYRSLGSSAEWIEEMPAALSGTFIPLDDFGSVRFLAGSATVGTTTMGIEAAGGSALSMINHRGDLLAEPSVLSAQSGFVVTRSDGTPTLGPSRSRYAPPRGTYR